LSPRYSDWGLTKKTQASLKEYKYSVFTSAAVQKGKEIFAHSYRKPKDYSTKGFFWFFLT